MTADGVLSSVIDAAVAQAKRAGHGSATPLHLAKALSRIDGDRFLKVVGAASSAAMDSALAALPRTFGTPAVSADLETLRARCQKEPSPVEFLWSCLRDIVPVPPAETPSAPPAGASPAQPEPPGAGSSPPVASPVAARSFRAALQTMVELLLVRALEASSGNRLLAKVFADAPAAGRLAAFARFVFESSPVIAVESEYAYVEGVIYEILASQEGVTARGAPVKPTVSISGDIEYLQVQIPERDRSVVLVPMHSGQQVVELGRFCHDLAAREVSAIIGCERLALLPEPLRRVTDIRLTLPALDRATFASLFESVFGEAPPSGWDQGGAQWVRHVQHFDFEQPQRLGLDASRALEFIREGVAERMRSVEPTGGRRLDQLHGLGEAVHFSRDLIHEIGEAVAGRLPWASVDRGMLLAGPPGTGKTTLARAIAKDCGVKFISASVAGWQTAGHLGDHIRAIRATFSEARRYAPSILFLDEIDSLGNREHFTGANAQYLTEVINAVLEQMQGLDPSAPVFVIAATNHPGRVDPALRRAGRLDRVVNIPYPTSEALSAMYADYLDAQCDGASLASAGIDLVLLGRMSLGLTGADVDLIVRGAARRARRGGGTITTQDLIAEITNKPRGEGGVRRLGPAELERVAIHESGHALARYLSSTAGEDLGFVSIVPRSDGSLGFVALAPNDRVLHTRRNYLELIDVALAGRAAEELRYGPDGVSGGCASDLVAATATALQMITRYGLGPSGRLLSVSEPASEHFREAEELLASSYRGVLERFRAHEASLNRLAAHLFEHQELVAEDVISALAGR